MEDAKVQNTKGDELLTWSFQDDSKNSQKIPSKKDDPQSIIEESPFGESRESQEPLPKYEELNLCVNNLSFDQHSDLAPGFEGLSSEDAEEGLRTSPDSKELASSGANEMDTSKRVFNVELDKKPILEDESSVSSVRTRKQRFSRCQKCILASSIIAVLFSISMVAGGFWAMFNAILKSQMEVKKGSKSYGIWETTPFPLILRLYIWNITNVDDFLQGELPDLEQCGPYVWKEYHKKQGIKPNPNNTVTYYQQRWWVWDEELSGNNTREDVVYTLNPVPISAAWSVRNQSFFIKALNTMFNRLDERAVRNVTVNQLVFTGFEDPILTWVQENVIAEDGPYHKYLPYLKIPPGLTDYDKFGWFYSRNMSIYYDGLYNMMTGTDDLNKVGKIDTWNRVRETAYFGYPCNNVTGSAGEYFEPHTKRDKVTLFSSDLCMSMTLFYNKDVNHRGLKAFRFWGSNMTFANGTTVPGNECYCVKGTCAPMGLINAESCRMGAPAFVSFPHYFHADPFLLRQVTGLSPDEDEHAFTMDIMPETGIPVRVRARMQINMRVTPYPGTGKLLKGRIKILANVPDIYLPMIWFEESAELPQSMHSQLKALQFIMSTPTMTITFSVILVLGSLVTAYIIDTKCIRKK